MIASLFFAKIVCPVFPLRVLEILKPDLASAIKTLMEGGNVTERVQALNVLYDLGYLGQFASRAIQAEAERGQSFLDSMNRRNWTNVDSTDLSELDCYKQALWMLSRWQTSGSQ